MPNFNAVISGFVTGDDLDVIRSITSIPQGQTVTTAWMTVKENPAAPDVDAIFQKEITVVSSPGDGQITDSGSSGTAIIRFEITRVETGLLSPGTLYYYDIQIKTSASKYYTPEKGMIQSTSQITLAV